MFGHRTNPAITAGLLGACALGQPEWALAQTLVPSSVGPLEGQAVPFALGCAVGAAATGIVAAVIHLVGTRRRAAEYQTEIPAPTQEREAESATADLSATSVMAPASRMLAQDQTNGPVLADDSAFPASPVAAPTADTGAAEPVHRINQAIASRIPEVDAPDATYRSDAVHEESANDDPNDYENVATEYVKGQTLAGRVAARARGVAEVLQERMGGDHFDGLPVIERADGSVGDVGTSWWDARLGESVRHVGTSTAPSDELAVPAWMDEVSSDEQPVAPKPTPAMEFANSRSAKISQSVAEVDQGKYPERRTADELDQDDLWEQALQAMGEKIDQIPGSSFQDSVGGVETIDDPDDLEDPTSFIPFRTPAGHPEVVDTESYVDYLIGDEFSRNQSQAARRSSREYLHVIQGGSQDLKGTTKLSGRRGRTGRSAYKPRHMAPPVAREA